MILWGSLFIAGVLLYFLFLYFNLWAVDHSKPRLESFLFKLTLSAGILAVGSAVCFMVLFIEWMIE